jgi:formylglycine-generating enzyme required for sulfatase activity
VPSLRDWLTRKQKESRRGRAELLLADRAAVWNARPENRQLPSLLQWLQIRRWTQKRTWTPPQQKMMRKAARHHLLRGGLTAALVLLLGLLGWDLWGRVQAHHLRDRLLEDAPTADVPAIVRQTSPYRYWLRPLLQKAYTQAEHDQDAHKQLHASLALAADDPGQVPYLTGRLLTAQAHEILAIRQALAPYQARLREDLWTRLVDPQADLDQRFRAACALAQYTPDDPRWEQVTRDVAAQLAIQKATELGTWAEALQPVGRFLLPPLARFLEDDKRSGAERAAIANLYRALGQDRPEALALLEKVLDEPLPAGPWEEAKLRQAKRQVNVAVALAAMGQGDKVWPLLKHTPDPTRRSYLIDRLATSGVDPRALLARAFEESQVSIRRALMLSLGEFGVDRLPEVERQKWVPRLLAVYRADPDPGIHGAAEWLLRQWQADAQLQQIDKELATGKVEDQRRWYINRQGQTFVLVPQPAGEVTVGEGKQRKERIPWSYFIGAKEVTVADYIKFRKDQRQSKEYARTDACPMMEVSWHDAAAYCNELSKQEGIDKDQWCYEPAGKNGEMRPVVDHLRRTGYRLATEAEWEYACRAGAVTAFCYGEPDELLARYGWFSGNSLTRSHPVGEKKPNDLGLFDMHGNAWEWCDDWYDEGASLRVGRGGSWLYDSRRCRAAFRLSGEPPRRSFHLGFRLARVSVGGASK